MISFDLLLLKVNNSCRKDKSVVYEIRFVVVFMIFDRRIFFGWLRIFLVLGI